MTQEIVRKLVNGVWETVVSDQGGGPGGGITEITSTDMSVTITDPTGPTVDLSVSGGSTPGAARWIGPWTIYEAALQAVAVSGADGGTFTITDDGDTTGAINWDADSSAVAAALNALNPGKWSASGDLGTVLELVASEEFAPVALITDGANLTSGGEPGGTAALQTPVSPLEVELLTQAIGDIVEDFLWTVETPFTAAGAHLALKTESGEFLSSVSAYPALNDIADGRTNYTGNDGNSGATSAPTAYGVELASGGPYPIIPAVCLIPSALGAYLVSVADADRAGVAHVYLKIATPAAP